MFTKSVINKAIMGSYLFLAAQNALAIVPMTVCPNAELLKSFDGSYIETYPIGFDPKNAAMTMAIAQRRTFGEFDSMFTNQGQLLFFISGIIEHEGEDAEKIAQTYLGKMQTDSEVPYMYRATEEFVVPVCSYSLPGDVSIKAVLFQAPEGMEMKEETDLRRK